jgi:hypothetical protein
MQNFIQYLLLAIPFITSLDAQDSVQSYSGPKERLHIYLLIGQSNMAGRAPFTEEEAGALDRVYLLNSSDQWEPAQNPLNRYSTIRKGLGMQKMNPGYTFSQTMLKADCEVSIGLVVNAKGGSSIKQWAKGTKFYEDAVRRTKAAMETGELKGILWHQGESDAKDAEYLEKLKTFIQNLRSEFGIHDLPFIAGQVNNVPLINDQIAKLPDAVESTSFVSSEELKCMDRWHFDAKSMKLLGQRYAEEMQKVLKDRQVEVK